MIMSIVNWKKYLPICLPLALVACSNDSERLAQMDAQVASANQKSDQALSVAQQAMQQAQDANARANQQFQRSLQK
jgi:hypothetical protein